MQDKSLQKNIAKQLLEHPCGKEKLSYLSRMLVTRAEMALENDRLIIKPCSYTGDLWEQERYIHEVTKAVKATFGEDLKIIIEAISDPDNQLWYLDASSSENDF